MSKQFTIANVSGEFDDGSRTPPSSPLTHGSGRLDSLTTIMADLAINKKKILPLLPNQNDPARGASRSLPRHRNRHEYIQRTSNAAS
jgi:hypothetical protein